MEQDKRGAGVLFPPPLIFVAAIILGISLNMYLLKIPVFSPAMRLSPVLNIIGVSLLFFAVLLACSALYQLHKARTSIEPWRPTSNIVSKGVFGMSRNPIYLAFICIDLGSALLFNNLWILLTLVPAVWALKVWVIEKEERYLQQKFGIQYSQYCAKVRRWL